VNVRNYINTRLALSRILNERDWLKVVYYFMQMELAVLFDWQLFIQSNVGFVQLRAMLTSLGKEFHSNGSRPGETLKSVTKSDQKR
jgi:hypothetical protein